MIGWRSLPGRQSCWLAALLVLGCRGESDTTHPDQMRWDTRYRTDAYVLGKEPVAFLENNVGLLPKGRALDVAAGEGRNAVFLAEHGFEVDAIDISPVGLAKADALAEERGVKIRTIQANLEEYDLGVEQYDVVANLYYLQRDLTPKIKRALKPGGVVIYETYTLEHLEMNTARGPKKRAYFLQAGELREMFKDFEILHYAETRTDRKAVASLIARKP